MALPYLVLLRAGFCLPPVLPRARCALTAPFHPYPYGGRVSVLVRRPVPLLGGIFSVPLSFRSPRPGVTRRTALRSPDFPPTCAFGLRRAVVWLTATFHCTPAGLAVGVLRDLILLQLLVQIAPRGVDDFRGLRDVPPILAQLGHEVCALGVVLELAERASLRGLAAAGRLRPGKPARRRRGADDVRQIGDLDGVAGR